MYLLELCSDWSTDHSYATCNKCGNKRVRRHPNVRRPMHLQEFKDAVHAGVVLDVRNKVMASDMAVPTVKQKWVITWSKLWSKIKWVLTWLKLWSKTKSVILSFFLFMLLALATFLTKRGSNRWYPRQQIGLLKQTFMTDSKIPSPAADVCWSFYLTSVPLYGCCGCVLQLEVVI